MDRENSMLSVKRSILAGSRAYFIYLFVLTLGHVHAQGLNNLWMGGYGSQWGLPWGSTNIDFGSGSANIYYVDREMDFARTAANITDSNGNLLFSTNGYYIADAFGDTMQNGTGLNPSWYTSLYPDGLHLSQADLILPKPDDPDIFYLFHGTVDDPPNLTAQYLYLTIIDMSQNGGLGTVTNKNEVLISDDLNIGRITSVRHANGQDWWVFCHKANSSEYYRLLVTPNGISLPVTQDIGVFRPGDHGQMGFSPDGSKFAYYWGEEDLDIFKFDRCSGLFYDPVHIDINDENAIGGVAFSPNSRFLYVPSLNDVYQFDTEATDIESSMVHIAEWDSTYSPSPPFATLFDVALLAPDGKIYIATGNSTFKLHVIHDPDQPGMACNIEQHGITLPTYFFDSFPNHPNYHLLQLPGSPCDTLGVGIGELPPNLNLSLYPNPSNGMFNLSYAAQSTEGTLEVYNINGSLVYQENIAPWSTFKRVQLDQDLANGIYQCRLQIDGILGVIRFILEH